MKNSHAHLFFFSFGCAGSSLLLGLSLVVSSRGYSLVAEHGLEVHGLQ